MVIAQQNTTPNSLQANFRNPPHEAKPRTWMHAMSGNMTKEGFTKDLESMAKVGLGGLLLFNVTQGIPNGPVKYNSAEHHELIAHAASEAERLGLSFGVHNCDGWSSSGGPWVTPENSMKMVVWSTRLVKGGKKIKTGLDQPTTREAYYKDIAVIAYPSLASEIDDYTNQPIITSSDPEFNLAIISDTKKEKSAILHKNDQSFSWIQYKYQQPKTLRSVVMVFEDRHAEATLQTSEDGKKFKDIKKLFKVRTGKHEWAINDHFEPITSRFFRIQISNRNDTTKLKEIELSATYYLNNLLGRTSIARTEDNALAAIGNPPQEMIIPQEKIINITNDFKNESLETSLPKGNWTIVRFGYTSTGAFNNPASDEGRGLEVDKLSRPAFKIHYDQFIKKVVNTAGPVAPNALQYVEIDSYEMGGQNWTQHFANQFQKNFQYDLIPFLPLVAGRFVESKETSEAVLWDYRYQICDMMTKNYFQYFTELCHKDGLQSYIEPYGFGPLNDLDVGGTADIPMGEFWMNRPVTMAKSAISSAHIYGKPVISAESFTSNPTINWKGHPAMAKNSGDLAWTMGINEFMFHRFVHQANTHVEPGMTMNKWGFHFDRTQTWWENAGKDWFTYIARGSYLLRQGHPVSDLLVFVGDGAPNSSYRRDQFQPEIPKTINFDCVNSDVLHNRIKAENGKLMLPEGTSYNALILKNSKKLKLTTLKRIASLAKNGITIYGDKPEKLAGYGHSRQNIEEFQRLVEKVSAKINPIQSWKAILTDKVEIPDFKVEGRDDITFAHRKTKQEDIYFFFNPDSIATNFKTTFRVSNKIPELWNPMNGMVRKMAQFESGKNYTTTHISLDAGEAVFVIFKEKVENKAPVSLEEPSITGFQNFYTLLNTKSYQVQTVKTKLNKEYTNFKLLKKTLKMIPEPVNISSDWNLQFDTNTTLALNELKDWKDQSNEDIKYFSGTATYEKKVNIPVSNKDYGVILDLGTVHIVADVFVNNQFVKTLWMPPFKVDISNYIQSKENKITIKVTNQWSNKLIGDERFPANDGGYQLGPHRATDLTMPDWYVKNQPLPEGKRTTFTTAPFYTKDDSLMPSGLLGPVQLYFYSSNTITLDYK